MIVDCETGFALGFGFYTGADTDYQKFNFSCHVECLFRGQIQFLPQTQQATAASPEMSKNILTFALSMTQDQRRGRGEKVIPLGCLIFVSPSASHVGGALFL